MGCQVRRSLVIPANKIVNTVVFRDGLDVRAENRVKREVFLCQSPLLLNTYRRFHLKIHLKILELEGRNSGQQQLAPKALDWEG